jgi:DNA-binding XRE family transcriptional regulator
LKNTKWISMLFGCFNWSLIQIFQGDQRSLPSKVGVSLRLNLADGPLFAVIRQLKLITIMSLINVELLKLGWRIRTSREKLGWSQKDFSRQCGIDRVYFGGIERGERNLTFLSLCQICTGLNCDIAAVTHGLPFR